MPLPTFCSISNRAWPENTESVWQHPPKAPEPLQTEVVRDHMNLKISCTQFRDSNNTWQPTKTQKQIPTLHSSLFTVPFPVFIYDFFWTTGPPQTNFRSFGGIGVVSLIRSILCSAVLTNGVFISDFSTKNCPQSGKSLITWHQMAKDRFKKNTEDPENSLDWIG